MCWMLLVAEGEKEKNKRTDAIKRKKKKINFKRRKDEYRPKREKKKKKKNERRRRVRSYIGGKCPIQQEEEENGEEEEEEGLRNSARSRSAHTFRLGLPGGQLSRLSSSLFLFSPFISYLFQMLFPVGTDEFREPIWRSIEHRQEQDKTKKMRKKRFGFVF
jgi:hypothetical protein